MKRNYGIVVCLGICVLALPAYAQSPRVKAVKALLKNGNLPSTNALTQAVSRNACAQYTHANTLASNASEYAPAFPAFTTVPTLPALKPVYIPPTTTSPARTRSWLEQQKRNLKAWQLKREHSKQVAFAQELAALPKLRTEQVFFTDDLTNWLVPEISLSRAPQVPFMTRHNYLYRGLKLEHDGTSLRQILRHGLLLKDAGGFSNSFLVSLATTPQDAAAISSTKYTNLAKSPQFALNYAFRSAQQVPGKLPIMISVTGESEYSDIVRVQHDIPVSQIYQVIGLLHIEQQPTWCLIELEGDTFKITPYERK